MTEPRLPEESIFAHALEFTSAAERAAFLDRACGHNQALRTEVEALLRAHDRSGNLLDLPENVPVATDLLATLDLQAREGRGTVIGPYKLLEPIGEGGMGTVWMAEQTDPIQRRVAVKVVKEGMDSRQVLARFEAERQALALMEHPNIAKVLDAGKTPSGRPYFVMELVKGRQITNYCDENRLGVRERLVLFGDVCKAVQHAHQKGIIHRDLKPSNVLVAPYDGTPVVKVIDFGVAKATGQRLTDKTLFTGFGALVGTPEYMSPEQAEVNNQDIDTRSDVYSLGVLLYELLTGSTPLTRNWIKEAALLEVLRVIREEEPPRPSTRLSDSKDSLPSISAQRQTEPAKLTKLVRGELDWIVMKSLDKDRTRRYETANGFARDIQRYLDGDPVEACPPSASYKLRKFARKHRAALATVGAFTLLLVVATTVSAGLALWANRERVRAVKAEFAAKEQKGRAEEREQLAIDAVKRFADVVRETPELKNRAQLATLRSTLLKEPQTFFTRLRDRLQADRETTPDSLTRLAKATFDLGMLTDEIGDKQDALGAYEESLAIWDRLARQNPGDTTSQSGLAWAHHNIGRLERETGRTDDALASYAMAVAIRELLVSENPAVFEYQRDLAKSFNSIGILRSETGRRTDALASYGKAQEILERLARENPAVTSFQSDLAQSYNNVGYLMSETGRPAEALVSYGKALEISEQLARENPAVTEFQQGLAASYNNIGRLQTHTSSPAHGLASYGKALEILERLARENPTVTAFQDNLAFTHNNVGVLQSELGRLADARASHTKALEIRERLARENPTVTTFQHYLAWSHNNIGYLQHQMGRSPDALVSFGKALELMQRLARENPTVTAFQSDLALSHSNIGSLQRLLGRPADALIAHRKSLEIRERLVQQHPQSTNYGSDLGATLNNMATIDLVEHRPGPAREKLAQAIAAQKKALAIYPDHPTYRQFLANHLTNLIEAAEALGSAAEAADAKRELLDLRNSDPQVVALDARLAAVLNGQAPKNDAERIQLALRAYAKSLHSASEKLFAEALANNPKLADDRQAQHRYNAACAAALAASGAGKDGPPPDDTAKAKLRDEALEWLKAELAVWTKLLESSPPHAQSSIAETLKQWQEDTDLTGIRDPIALDAMPESERADWRRLWAEVANTLARARADATTEKKPAAK